jgi:hypothetical protein
VKVNADLAAACGDTSYRLSVLGKRQHLIYTAASFALYSGKEMSLLSDKIKSV